MTVLAIATGSAVIALIGLILGLAVALLVVNLLQSVLRPIKEIDRYAQDILVAGVGIATNLDGVDELARTRTLGGAVPGLAVAVLKKTGAIR